MSRVGLVYGVGVNDSDYNTRKVIRENGVQKTLWICPFYRRWRDMLKRCYSLKFHETSSTYKDCSVCDEWLTFSNFKAWMEKQDWEGKELDKDLLVSGNKVYSHHTCVFIHRKINSFLIYKPNVNGLLLLGASLIRKTGKFEALCGNPFLSKQERLGTFNTELEAHLAWKARKHELAYQLADSEYVTDDRVREALRNRYKPLDNPS